MQEGILQIGKAVYDKENFLNNIVEKIDIKDKKGNPKYIIQINFDTKSQKIEIKLREEANTKSPQNLLWIGTADGPSSPQWYTTGNKPTYLISQVIPNLVNMEIEGLSNDLKSIFDNFFYDMGELDKRKKRYRYVIDLSKLSTDLKSNEEILKECDGDVKKAIKKVEKEINDYIKKELGIKPKEVALYFLSIDNVPISDNKEYRKRVKKEKLKAFEQGEKGVCSICSSKEGLSSDTSKLQLKFYTTTNLNFPSGFSKKNYSKNMLLCKECMLQLIAGEQFIMDKLKTNIGGLQIYLIPHFLYDSSLTRNDMELISERIMDTFTTSKKVEGIVELEGEIWDTIDLSGKENYYLLNILFYKSSQQAVKVQKLIKDVHPSRFSTIINNSHIVRNDFKKLISNKLSIPFGLESVYYLIPVKIKQGEIKEYRKLLTIYEAIFKKLPIKKDMLLKSQIKLMRIHYFENQRQYNVKKAKLHNAMIQSNMFFKFLENIGCLERGRVMDTDKLNIEDDMKNYIEEMRYNEEEAAMFLLGCLVGKVGNKQYTDRSGKKPILNKLNFNGMDISKTKRLSSEIVSKLRQNKILKYNEKLYAAHKQLFDKNIKNWSLNKHDNLYYILSGYSYVTSKTMLREGGSKDE
ncbi:TIGR02556 family CRISPR-associated protein [Thermohalobacter berrensis]|uniref:Type I-B CRISPR-associated protein Cas8b/Csh1 n=1 Tax=Thermohalobacter berrensis TaxID=99594 RepID=A0A419T1E2_9FIRM|nr:TIGR02556 family CRISPR-associated protein [Thermohalobacter berrensis]RKD31273.1 hypothetical protein BET03_03860 [Thermohalobacter berrensis]